MTQEQFDKRISVVLKQLQTAASRKAEEEVRRRWREERGLVFVNAKPYFRPYKPKNIQQRGALQ